MEKLDHAKALAKRLQPAFNALRITLQVKDSTRPNECYIFLATAPHPPKDTEVILGRLILWYKEDVQYSTRLDLYDDSDSHLRLEYYVARNHPPGNDLLTGAVNCILRGQAVPDLQDIVDAATANKAELGTNRRLFRFIRDEFESLLPRPKTVKKSPVLRPQFSEVGPRPQGR